MYEQLGFYIFFGVIIFIWIYYDAKYRMFKAHPLLWATAALIIPLIIIVYLLYRKPKIK